MLPEYRHEIRPLTRKRKANLVDFAQFSLRFKQLRETRRKDAFSPKDTKELRRFSLNEVCTLVGLHHTKITELAVQNPGLSFFIGEVTPRATYYTLEQVHHILSFLNRTPRQRFGIKKAAVITIANFKGGVAKTFTSVAFSQYLALKGYKVLLLDLDPQASLTSSFGFDRAEIDPSETMLPFYYGPIELKRDGFEMPTSLRTSIKETYWHGLDVVPACLTLQEGDWVIGQRGYTEPGDPEKGIKGFRFYEPVDDAVESVKNDYDVIIIDTPPVLSFTTTCSLYACDGLVVPLTADRLDLDSTDAFINLGTDVLQGITKLSQLEQEFEIFRVITTRYRENIGEQKIEDGRISFIFEDWKVPYQMPETVTVQKGNSQVRTLYEADPKEAGRTVLKRAMEWANLVNESLEDDLIDLFRSRQQETFASGIDETNPENEAAM